MADEYRITISKQTAEDGWKWRIYDLTTDLVVAFGVAPTRNEATNNAAGAFLSITHETPEG